MKTIELFAEESNRSLPTVESWIKKGLVNGAEFIDGEYIISDLARPPYTRARNNSEPSIRKGIVIGCKRRLSVNDKTLKISEHEFAVYLGQLINAGLIEKKIIDGYTYYFSTPKTDTMSEGQIKNVVRNMALLVVEGAFRVFT